jgi:hypothetical protein
MKLGIRDPLKDRFDLICMVADEGSLADTVAKKPPDLAIVDLSL